MHPSTPAPWAARMRQASGLSPARRRVVHIERDELLVRLEELDRPGDERAAARREVVVRLGQLRDVLWPVLRGCRARRPPAHDQAPLPPVRAGADFLAGRPLRAACRAILARQGTLALVELHAALHLDGYAVASPRPVQALADAMGYEVGQGRARRVRRGVYALVGDGPPPVPPPPSPPVPPPPVPRAAPPLPDPVVHEAPSWHRTPRPIGPFEHL